MGRNFFVLRWFVMCRFVPTFTYYDAFSIVIEDFGKVTIPVLWSHSASKHFGSTETSSNMFFLVSGKNRTRSVILVLKVLFIPD